MEFLKKNAEGEGTLTKLGSSPFYHEHAATPPLTHASSRGYRYNRRCTIPVPFFFLRLLKNGCESLNSLLHPTPRN